jgi:hypothetical protein
VSGRLTDFIARPVRQSVLLTPPASIQFLVVVQAGLYRQRRDVIRIDMGLTSQTVVFAFLVCRRRGDFCRSFSIFQRTRSESLQQRREKMPRSATAERGKS